MKVLAFAASNSRDSINRALVEHAAGRLKQEFLPRASIEFIDIDDYEMPIFSKRRESEGGAPEEAKALLARIGAADALLVSFPEHNGTVSAAWKNIFDWMSRIERRVWQDKPMVILAATPGKRAGAGVLGGQKDQVPRFGAVLLGAYGVGEWGEAWDAEARALTRPSDIAGLRAALSGLSDLGQNRSAA